MATTFVTGLGPIASQSPQEGDSSSLSKYSAVSLSSTQTLRQACASLVADGYTGARGAIESFKVTTIENFVGIDGSNPPSVIANFFLSGGRALITNFLSAAHTKEGMSNVPFNSDGKGEEKPINIIRALLHSVAQYHLDYQDPTGKENLDKFIALQLAPYIDLEDAAQKKWLPTDDQQFIPKELLTQIKKLKADLGPDLYNVTSRFLCISRTFITDELEEDPNKVWSNYRNKGALPAIIEAILVHCIKDNTTSDIKQFISGRYPGNELNNEQQNEIEKIALAVLDALKRHDKYRTAQPEEKSKILQIIKLRLEMEAKIHEKSKTALMATLSGKNKEKDAEKILSNLKKQKIEDEYRHVMPWLEYIMSKIVAWGLGFLSLVAFGVLTYSSALLALESIVLPLLGIAFGATIIGGAFVSGTLPCLITLMIGTGVLVLFNTIVSYFFGLAQTQEVFGLIARACKNEFRNLAKTNKTRLALSFLVAIPASALTVNALQGFIAATLGLSIASSGGIALLAIVGLGCFIGSMCLLYKLSTNWWTSLKTNLTRSYDPKYKTAFWLSIVMATVISLALMAVAVLADFSSMQKMLHGAASSTSSGLSWFTAIFSTVFNTCYTTSTFQNIREALRTSMTSTWEGWEKAWKEGYLGQSLLISAVKWLPRIGVVGGLIAVGIIFGLPVLGQVIATTFIFSAAIYLTINFFAKLASKQPTIPEKNGKPIEADGKSFLSWGKDNWRSILAPSLVVTGIAISVFTAGIPIMFFAYAFLLICVALAVRKIIQKCKGQEKEKTVTKDPEKEPLISSTSSLSKNIASGSLPSLHEVSHSSTEQSTSTSPLSAATDNLRSLSSTSSSPMSDSPTSAASSSPSQLTSTTPSPTKSNGLPIIVSASPHTTSLLSPTPIRILGLFSSSFATPQHPQSNTMLALSASPALA